ncbi:MAG: hypothetical protein JW720_08170 [Sedimentisphaerales bacterium]|nr:hypothetical protein [Sedimentisphaerales bacterium]
MTKKHKAIRIAEHGFLTDERNEPILCPVRGANCTLKCAWFSADDRILRCKDTIIGALRGKSIRSFRLHTGPDVYNVDESLLEYEVHSHKHMGN